MGIGRYLNKKRISRGVEIEDSIMTVTEKEEAVIETPFERSNLNFLLAITFLVLAVMLGRVFFLDYIKGEYFSDVSKGNRIRQISIKAPRGKIMDKFGKTLVKNVPSIDVVVVPRDLPESYEERKKIYQDLATTLSLEEGNVEIAVESQNRKLQEPILIKENISSEEALVLTEDSKKLRGVSLEKTAIRSYENSFIFSHIIGYDGKITQEELKNNEGYLMTDYIGKTGLEKSYEKYLRGIHGARQVEVDSLGNVKKELGNINPIPGSDLILNIDEGLQKKIYDSLTTVMEASGDKTAAAVAIDPRNGGVLAMVSLPSFDNNLFAKGISNDDYQSLASDKNLPLFNRVIKGEYPPGSTIKPIISVGALAEKTIEENTKIDGLGGILNVGGFSFRDWKVHGQSDVRTAIAESNDIFFYTIGGGYGNIQGLGMDRMKHYYNLFGLGEKTGIDILGEEDGLIPSEKWKEEVIGERWYMGNSYHAAIGQGYVLATPIQLASFTAAVANGGTLYAPRIVGKIKANDGTETNLSSKIIRENFISDSIVKVVREGMRQTIESGTAQTLKNLPIKVAGKTGTAQFGTEDKTHAWFISFAPYDNPEIAMVVLVEGGGEGHSSAVPVTRDVYDWYFGERE